MGKNEIQTHRAMYNAYRLLAILFLGPIDARKMLQELFTQESIESESFKAPLCNVLDKHLKHLLMTLERYLHDDNLWREFNIDYTGCTQPKPGGTKCHIYESVYATRGSEMPAIRASMVLEELVKYYKTTGLEPSGIRSPDHISVELDYLAALHMAQAEALSQNKTDLADQVASIRRQFISEHAAKWMPEMINCILSCANDQLLKLMAESLRVLLECEDKISS